MMSRDQYIEECLDLTGRVKVIGPVDLGHRRVMDQLNIAVNLVYGKWDYKVNLCVRHSQQSLLEGSTC